MYQEPEPMRKLHEIRFKLYEEHKNLTPEQHVAKVHKEAEAFIKKYGVKVKRAAQVG